MEVQECLEEERDSSEYDSEEEARTIHGLPLASFPGSRAHTTFDPKRLVCLGSKVGREIVA